MITKMMDIDPKKRGARDSLIIPSTIRGDLGAFASANTSTGTSNGGGLSPLHGSQQLQLGQRQRFDEDSSLSLIKVGYKLLESIF